MGIDEIYESIENINSSFERFQKDGIGAEHSICRLFYEFDPYDSGYSVEDIIVNMAIGEIITKQESVYEGNYNCIKGSLNKFSMVNEEIEKSLGEELAKGISLRVKKVLNELETMEVKPNPHYELKIK